MHIVGKSMAWLLKIKEDGFLWCGIFRLFKLVGNDADARMDVLVAF